ncbi:MAG: 2'-5' RNA ligase family protein [Ferroplasma sp.]|uniref:2'-5' RNA ligase family protein n=1 Tax=Ferroplasma sp. TaxID=2591003 RepID=UPI002814E320|nr:2'-5' RNA ligase family protein [Ferroplasma sp.]WMT51988.1 MAG: 2'-5' RNA ligase family protein [Ferroplasma sp.]
MQYTLILKPPINIRNRITRIKKNLEALYGYTGSLSCKGVHITMAYLRNPESLDINAVEMICKSTSPFYFDIGGAGYFQKEKNGKKSYIVYLSVIPSPEMVAFHSMLVRSLDLNAMDRGIFVPHITLIRKNVDGTRLNGIMEYVKNLNVGGHFYSEYLIMGKRKKQNTHWHFEHFDFSKI